MGRRVSNGVVGAAGSIGQLSIVGNTLTTTQNNTNLIIDPQGTGVTQFVGNLQANGNATTGGEVRLMDADSSNYVALRSVATIASNKTLMFPDSVGTNGQVLTTDGANPATISWTTPAAAGVSLADSTGGTALRLYHGSSTSGQLTSANSNSALTFVPSTAALGSTIGQFPTLQGGVGTSGTLTILSTTSGTKATAGILMTESIASTTTGTGTLVITGGLGVGGRVNATDFTGTIGNNTRSAGLFTTLTSNAATTFTAGTASTTTGSGSLIVTGGVGVSGQVTAATVVETSSIAFKENVNPIEDALNKILQLVGVTYDRKDGSKINEAGLIAEEVNKVLPNLVSKDDEGNAYGLQYTKLVAYLIESVKTLNTRIEQLETK
jgi:hypothetical protein